MKRLITIILAFIMAFFTSPSRGADEPPVTAEKPPQAEITVSVEDVPEESQATATSPVGEGEKTESTAKPAVKPAVNPEDAEIGFTEEETADNVGEGERGAVEYKPQIGGQHNPFENNTPTEIDDQPAEDYIGEGEDRPGEGIHF